MLHTPGQTLDGIGAALGRVQGRESFNWDHPVHRRTGAALKFVAELRDLAEATPERIYNFGRLPLTDDMRILGCDPDRISDFLGYGELPLGGYRPFPDSASPPYWLHWRRQDLVDTALPGCMKLYVSTTLEGLRETVRRSIRLLCGMGIASFKLGADIANLARPDHFVIFVEERQVADLAAELGQLLQDLPALGVPFTLPVTPSGLVSVAMDPKELRHIRTRDRKHSWRSFVAELLASDAAPRTTDPEAFWTELGVHPRPTEGSLSRGGAP